MDPNRVSVFDRQPFGGATDLAAYPPPPPPPTARPLPPCGSAPAGRALRKQSTTPTTRTLAPSLAREGGWRRYRVDTVSIPCYRPNPRFGGPGVQKNRFWANNIRKIGHPLSKKPSPSNTVHPCDFGQNLVKKQVRLAAHARNHSRKAVRGVVRKLVTAGLLLRPKSELAPARSRTFVGKG